MKKEIGRRLFLFKSPNRYASNCIISSHGGKVQWLSNSTFTVPPGTTLIFYSDDGESVSDEGIANFATIEFFAKRKGRTYFEDNECPNDDLSK